MIDKEKLIEAVAKALKDAPLSSTWIDQARAAIASIEASGWAVVPVSDERIEVGDMDVVDWLNNAAEMKSLAVHNFALRSAAREITRYRAMFSVRSRITGETP